MIKIICGPKGTGKTKIILDEVQKAVQEAKGNIVFITDKKMNTAKIDFNVRCVYANDFDVCSVESFRGFVCGLMAGNSDIEYLFIDGVVRIIGTESADLNKLFEVVEKLESEYNFNAVMTVSVSAEDMPENLKKYIA